MYVRVWFFEFFLKFIENPKPFDSNSRNFVRISNFPNYHTNHLANHKEKKRSYCYVEKAKFQTWNYFSLQVFDRTLVELAIDWLDFVDMLPHLEQLLAHKIWYARQQQLVIVVRLRSGRSHRSHLIVLIIKIMIHKRRIEREWCELCAWIDEPIHHAKKWERKRERIRIEISADNEY